MLIKNLFRYWTYQLFSPETVLKEKYDAFKSLLAHDKAAHEHLAALEELYYHDKRHDFQAVIKVYEQFSRAVSGMVQSLFTMCPSGSRELGAYFKKFDFYIRFMLAPPAVDCSPPFTIPFNRAASFDEATVGKKTFNLSCLAAELHLPTPNGFVVTTHAFHYFMACNHLEKPINEKLAALDINDAQSLERTAADIKALILNAHLPCEISTAMNTAVEELQKQLPTDICMALRSSAVKEDGQASFAGQYLTLLNVNAMDIQESYKKIIAGKYASQALFYRINHGILDSETPMAVLILEMKDAVASGVMYTRDIADLTLDHMVIHSVWGQGELLVNGKISPDIIRISRKNPNSPFHTFCQEKQNQMGLVPNTRHNTGYGTCTIKIPPHKKNLLSLEEPDILTLARWGISLEKHFNHPQDIEWCKDISGVLFILQSRPLHVNKKIKDNTRKEQKTSLPHPKKSYTILCSGGQRVCSGIASGVVYKLDEKDARLEKMPWGSVLVVRHASPRLVTAIDKMAAVIMASGSSASHFSSIAREFGVPAMVNVRHGFDKLIHGHGVTVDADTGMVYDGILPSLPFKSSQSRSGNGIAFKNSSFMLKLRYVMDFAAKLKLIDPGSPHFTPGGCRSLHDIVRFAHETAVKEMFFSGSRKGRPTRGAKKLIWSIPMLFYLMDVGNAFKTEVMDRATLTPDDIESLPMKWILKGLLTPGIHWSEATHFDWETHDKIVMSGGIIPADSPRFGSYAVVSKEYVNINFRFGYHFVILDTICTTRAGDNYILFRFSGGGGEPKGRQLRAAFIEGILTRLGFEVTVQSDLVDGEFKHGTLSEMKTILEIIGKLLGASKLMDMYIKKEQDMDFLIDGFMAGRYDFRQVQ
ncbi:pyruvate, water dikinase [Desulfocicer vacuolatum DSM 3385]|uniref:Phosphoenolpyruvate synthase n=1 Tax=Desulfocicer vacuolatum DSM 3385 TaxID=1121400 RepID=A0A1W2DB70_9BACT|nr:PEP/pyruvate-binding domain-containing protein [Desulfocicer vacuolatum]SMC94759.1 pyruvate, water dikinase [Desulfocicer vacuolatum DSM 3385]